MHTHDNYRRQRRGTLPICCTWSCKSFYVICLLNKRERETYDVVNVVNSDVVNSKLLQYRARELPRSIFDRKNGISMVTRSCEPRARAPLLIHVAARAATIERVRRNLKLFVFDACAVYSYRAARRSNFRIVSETIGRRCPLSIIYSD